MSYQIGNAALGVTFTGDLGSLQRTLDQAGGSVDQFGRRSTAAMRGVAGEAARADDAMSRLANGIKGAFVGGSVAVGLVMLKNNLIGATDAIIDAQVRLDKLNNSLRFAAGARAADQIAYMRAEVDRLGLDLGVTANQFAKFSAATLSVGVPTEKANRIFSGLAQTMTTLGLAPDQVDRALNAVVQSFSKGQVMAEEIRGQFGEHVPAAFEMAAQAMGMTAQQLNKDMEAGLIKPLEFWSRYAEYLFKKTDDDWEQAATSMQATLNRLSTSWLNFKQQFAQSGAGAFLSDQINVLSGDLKVLGDVMEASRQRGEGFWMTIGNTAGAAAGRAAFGALAGTFNVFNATVNALTGNVFGLNENISIMPMNLRSASEQLAVLQTQSAQAQARLERLKALDAQPMNGDYFKGAIAKTEILIARLKEAQDEQRKLLGGGTGPGITGGVVSGDVALARAQRAQYDQQVTARDALLKRLATPAEKLSEELRTQKDLLGELFTPEIEARIRANFIKPTREGGAAANALTKEFERLQERMGTELAAGAAQAQAAQQGLNGAQVDFLKLAASPVWAQLSNTQRADLALLYERRIAQEQMADSLKASTQAAEALARAEDAHIKTYTDTAGRATSRLEEMRAEAAAMAYAEQHHVSLAVAIEETAMARLREAQAAEMAKGTGMNDSVVLALQAEIDARRQMVAAIAGREVREAGQKLREDEAAEWARTWDQVSQSFTDALMQGGKSVAEYLKGLFRTLVLRPILAPVGAAMASLLGGPAAAGQGGGAGGLSSLSILQNLINPSKIFSSFGDSLAFAADSAGQWLVQNTSGMLNQLGGKLMGNAGAVGTIGSYAGGAMAGLGIGKAISGGYSAFGRTGNTAVNAGTVIGSILGGPIGGAIGGAIGGLVNRAFGRKAPVTQSQGISGTFSEAGANVQQYQDWFAKGGWFRSNKSGTNYSAVSAEMDGFLDAALAQVGAATRGYAALMGLNADALNGITQSVKINLKGLDAQKQEQAIADALAGFGSRLAQELLGTFETTLTQRNTWLGRVIETSVTTWVAGPFVRAGETAGEALQRLGMALGVTNQIFDTLGSTLFAASLQGADLASQLVDVFGGLENLQAATAAYYQAFYSDAERLATGTRQMGQALQALGVAVPTSRDGFRALVEAQDLTTEAGRSTYAALMGLAPAFAELTQAMEQMGSSVRKEVQRLRGLLVSDSSTGLAALQAQFATGTAMARAGDADALDRLPELSQAIEAAAALQARTAVDVALMRGQLAASLSETLGVLGLKVPAFEVGTNYVPRTMLAQVHEGEAIVPKAYNPAAGGGAAGGDALARRVDALVQELQGLRAEVRSGVTHNAKMARILDRVARDGNAFVTVAEA